MLTRDYLQLKRGYNLRPENPDRYSSLLSLLSADELSRLEYNPERAIYTYNEEKKGNFPEGKVVHIHPEQGVAFEIDNTPARSGLFDRGLATHIFIDDNFRTICCSMFRPMDYLQACSESNNLLGQLERFIHGGFPHLTNLDYPVKGAYIFRTDECGFDKGHLRLNGTGFSFPHDYSENLLEKMVELSINNPVGNFSNGSIDTHSLALNEVHHSEKYSPAAKHELSLMIMMNLRIMHAAIDEFLERYDMSVDSESDHPAFSQAVFPTGYVPPPEIINAVRSRQMPGIVQKELFLRSDEE